MKVTPATTAGASPATIAADPAQAPDHALPRRFRRNVITTYLSTIVSAGQVLVITPFLVRGLGQDRYGIWALVGSIALFANLFDLGVGAATIQFVAEHEGRGERSRTLRTVGSSFWLLVALGGGVVLLGAIVAAIFPNLFSTPGQEAAAQVLVLIVAFDVAFGIVGATFQGCLGGMQRYSLLNAILIATVLTQAIAFAVVLTLGGKLVALGIMLLTVGAAEEVTRYLAMRHYVPEVTLSPRIVDRAEVKRLFGRSLWIGWTNLSQTVRYRIDIIIVGAVVGVRAAGVYGVGQLLFIAADRFIRPLLTGFFPHSAELAARNETGRLTSTMTTGTRIILAAAGPLCLAAILLARPTLHAWVGSSVDDARMVVVYLLSALLLGAISRAGLLVLQGSGGHRVVTVLIWSEAMLNLVLSIVLAKTMGLTGVALATLISTAAVSTAVGVPIMCRAFGISTTRFVLRICRAHIPAIGAALLIGWLISPSRDAGFAVVVPAGAAIVLGYLLTLSITDLSRAERGRLLASARRLKSA